ncbi:RNA methyltransferase [Tolypothrix sp. PCC 7601]|nr:RNA methyltransferase [Tolypothrix sp. PCC 7601]
MLKQDLRKQNLSLRLERSVGKQSQNLRRLRRCARNDVIT